LAAMSLAGRAARIGLGVAGAFIGYAWLPHLFTGTATWRGPVQNRAVALTFDDGPDPRWTPRVLDVLAAHGARATFFLIGRRAAAAPDVVRAIADAGHEVANHTWSHPSLWLCSPRRTEHEIARGHVTLAELTGVAPRHFRPPWGMVNAAMGRALTRTGERCVFWSLQPEGLRPRSAEAQAEYVVTRVSPGAVIGKTRLTSARDSSVRYIRKNAACRATPISSHGLPIARPIMATTRSPPASVRSPTDRMPLASRTCPVPPRIVATRTSVNVLSIRALERSRRARAPRASAERAHRRWRRPSRARPTRFARAGSSRAEPGRGADSPRPWPASPAAARAG